jgi:diacylglycerol kinase family enzyme
MPGNALITNPFSGRNRRDPSLRSRLLAAMGAGTLDLAPEGPEGWPAVAAELLEQGIETVGVSGGDGTTHCLLTALAKQAPSEEWPKVALLRAGTMNTLAANLGIRGRPTELAAGIGDAHAVPVPCLDVDGQVGFLFGVGVPVSFLEAYYDGPTGPVGGAWLLAKAVAGFPFGTKLVRSIIQPHALRVEIDGERWPIEQWRAVGASTVPSLGLGFQVCAHTPAAGRLEAYGFGGTGWAMIRNLPRMKLGMALAGPLAPQALGQSVVIEGDRDLAFMVDGDLFRGGRRLEVRVGGTVQLLRPADARPWTVGSGD